jgi:HK97 family phage major capsid protein
MLSTYMTTLARTTITALNRTMDMTLPRLGEYTADQLTLARANNFVRFVCGLVAVDNRVRAAKEDYAIRYPRSLDLDLLTKAAVDAGTTYAPGWGALAQPQPWQAGFLELAQPPPLLTKIADVARSVPTNTSVAAQSSGGTFAWTGQGATKPTGNMAFQSFTLGPAKATGLIVVTSELMKLATPASVTTLRNDLGRGLQQFLDTQFVDPSVAAVTNVSPGSITNLAPSFGSSGTSAANALTDLKKLYAQFFAANPDATSAIVLMSPANAAAAAAATGWQALTANGGELWGVRVETSAACGARVVMFDAGALAVADAGTIEIVASRQATVEMDTAGTSPQGAGSVLVSLWQLDLVALRCERGINWRLGRNSACVYTVATWV